MIALVAAGCQDTAYEYHEADAPRYAPVRVEKLKRPVVALVLGSGGRRGFAHVGVLKALEAGQFKPDLIVGVSIGSVVGAMYASGMSAAEIEKLALELDLAKLFDISFRKPGRVHGQALQNLVNDKVGNKPLDALGLRFAAVATRRSDGVQQIFNAGNTGVAVQASSAVPERILPVRIGGDSYEDGDTTSPVPVRAARLLGADVVIAVDISAQADSAPAHAPDNWRARDQRRRTLIDAEIKGADVVIHPDLGYYAGTSPEYRRRAIAAAEAATLAALPKIKAAIVEKRAATKPTAPLAAPAPPPPAAR